MTQKTNWQPITTLPNFSKLVNGMFKTAKKQQENLLKAKNKVQVLNSDTILHSLKAYQDELARLDFCQEQFQYWQKLSLAKKQQQEIVRLMGQVTKLKKGILDIFKRANCLKNYAINNRASAKEDTELLAMANDFLDD